MANSAATNTRPFEHASAPSPALVLAHITAAGNAS